MNDLGRARSLMEIVDVLGDDGDMISSKSPVRASGGYRRVESAQVVDSNHSDP